MLRYLLLTAALLALALPAAAIAEPLPIIQSVAASGTTPAPTGPDLHTNDLSVAWTLGPNEYACALTLSNAAAERTLPLTPTATSYSDTIAATPGTTITVTLEWVSVSALTTPDNACFQTRARTVAATTAAAYVPPAPPEAPSATTATATPTVTTTTTTDPTSATTATATPAPAGPTTTDLETRIVDLEAQLAALSTRVDAIAKANEASWTAYIDARIAGASDVDAALAARSAGLNAIYGVTP